MELTTDEKQSILNNRLKQFAVEKYNHEINLSLLNSQKDAEVNLEKISEISSAIEQSNEAVSTINKAMVSISSMNTNLKVEPTILEDKVL
jgi:methionine synthase II (cobalamin-independent)